MLSSYSGHLPYLTPSSAGIMHFELGAHTRVRSTYAHHTYLHFLLLCALAIGVGLPTRPKIASSKGLPKKTALLATYGRFWARRRLHCMG